MCPANITYLVDCAQETINRIQSSLICGKEIHLRRTLGLLEVTISGIGIILGAGIYALIGEAAGLAGNAVWISFALSALVAVLTGLSYAELASMFPRASAEYEYTSQAFGQSPAFLVGWLIIFSGVVGAATVSWALPDTSKRSLAPL